MVKIGYGGSNLEIKELRQTRIGDSKKVGKLKRKASNKVYESPRIVLDRHYKDFIGKKYSVYRGRAEYSFKDLTNYEGDCIVLFFPDKWNEKENVDVQLTVDKAEEGWEHAEGLITTLIPPLDIDAENTLVAIVGPPVVYKFVILALDEKKVPHNNIVISLERRMKCGEGKCGNCQIQDIYVCKDGPVFNYGKIEYLKEAI